MNRYRQTFFYLLIDFASAFVAWLLFNVFRYYETAQYNFSTLSDFLLYYQVLKGQILIPVFWLILHAISGYYNKPFGKSRLGELFTTFMTILAGAIIIFFVVVLNEIPHSFHIFYHLFFALVLIQFVLTYTCRVLMTNHIIKKIRRREWFETALIIGTGKNADKARENMRELGYQIAGFVRAKEEPETSVVPAEEIIGVTDELAELIEQRKIDEIVVAIDSGNIAKLMYSLYRYKKPVKIMAEKNDLLMNVKAKTIHGIPFIDVTENNFSEFEKNIKWLIDKAIAAFVLTVCSPLFAFIAIRVKIGSKGPVFFKQERIGYRGNPFNIYKFRTMYTDATKQGPLLTAIGDARVTSFGRFLRKYRLDEIPQFWNVLKNEMSLVGPRPEQRYFIDRIVEKAPYYYLLHNVRPGITSWGMVKYGYAETVDKMIERLDFDILYYENMSLILDITIMIYTVKIVFTGKGV